MRWTRGIQMKKGSQQTRNPPMMKLRLMAAFTSAFRSEVRLPRCSGVVSTMLEVLTFIWKIHYLKETV